MKASSFTPAELAALEAWADPTARRAVPHDIARFRRALAGDAKTSPAAIETKMRQWAEIMRADGTLGTSEGGRALARRFNLTTETR